MRKITYFLDNYGDLFLAFLMSILCILNIYVITIDWNIWSIVGAITCSISAGLNLIDFITKTKKRKI